MAWLTLLWGKVWQWVCGIGAFLALLGAAWLLGRSKGKAAEKVNTMAAESIAAAAQATVKQMESRHETDIEVQKLPDAPAQAVGTATAGTAAGKLRDDGWTRD